MANTAAQLSADSAWHAVVDALGVLAMAESAESNVGNTVEADARLVLAALDGDDDAFGRIVELHQRTIASQMRRFSRDQTTIEELVHDVFVEAFTCLRSYRGQSPLIHWLRKIAVRVGYRYWKQQARRGERSVQLSTVTKDLDRFASSNNENQIDASEILDGLLEALSVRDRLVLTLLYWDGCSVAEAAELSGWSKATVKIQAYRARKRLQQLIEESLK